MKVSIREGSLDGSGLAALYAYRPRERRHSLAHAYETMPYRLWVVFFGSGPIHATRTKAEAIQLLEEHFAALDNNGQPAKPGSPCTCSDDLPTQRCSRFCREECNGPD
jgi:hypothetical protein